MREPPEKSRFSEEAFPLQALTGTVIASSFEVFDAFGYGFKETVYKRDLEVELEYRGVRVDEEVPFDLYHRDKIVGRYRADTIVDMRVIVEVKTGPMRDPKAPDQLLNYLCSATIQLGLVLDFLPSGVKVRRVIASDPGMAARRRRWRRLRGRDQ